MEKPSPSNTPLPLKLPLTLAIITLNEAHNIERCLRSALFADDIVVLDSGSTDKTCEIAQSLGARVFVEQWRGYGKQKARAVELAKHSWVLSLDADEALSDELASEIKELFSNKQNDDTDVGAYRIPRSSFHLGRWLRHGSWYPDYQNRLFNKERAQWTPKHVHEYIECDKMGVLKHNIKHWVFKDLADNVTTNNEYSGLGAQELKDKGKKFYLWKLCLRPPIKFIEIYFYKRGFLDGLAGFILAVGAAYTMFLKFAKLWEKETQ